LVRRLWHMRRLVFDVSDDRATLASRRQTEHRGVRKSSGRNPTIMIGR
jgi:hypothetical protein